MDLTHKLANYIQKFNGADEENVCSTVPNDMALEFLRTRIPLVELPDSLLEEIYYFRWWTYRKHIRKTPEGFIITEFLPDVPWSGPYNAINCAAGFHLREGRWMADSEHILRQYISFWLSHMDAALSYSGWLAAAVEEYARIRREQDFALSCLSGLEKLFALRVRRNASEHDMYFSIDDRDGMEYSISGSGLRPTLNSYLCADAYALSRLFGLAGNTEKQELYKHFGDSLKNKLDQFLWTGDFYCTLPTGNSEHMSEAGVHELIGYIPWYFELAGKNRDIAFRELLCPDGFAAPRGLTTAVQRHPRFMEKHDHECLWNGPVWPFATSQTLVGVANALHRGTYEISKEDYFFMLRQYAQAHYRVKNDGSRINWIDEVLDPETGAWISRDILWTLGWKPELGGYERGKDYNHSLFCDLILSGLLGIDAEENGEIQVSPLIPDSWQYFRVENLYIGDKRYSILFDRDGTVYHQGKGLTISRT